MPTDENAPYKQKQASFAAAARRARKGTLVASGIDISAAMKKRDREERDAAAEAGRAAKAVTGVGAKAA